MTAAPREGVEEGVPFGDQLTRRAQADPDQVAVIMVAPDGTEHAVTLDRLDRGANQWGRVLAAEGAGLGDLVGIAIPNSLEFILAALGCWKIGAVPVPMRWDLPAWENSRLLEVLAAAVVVGEDNRDALIAESAQQDDAPLPAIASPMQNGICSSGSTGLPKIILNTRVAEWTTALSEPFVAHWAPVPRPQTILVPGPMYHTNGFNPLFYLLGGDRIVVLEKFSATGVLDAIERHGVTHFTATPTMLGRIADAGAADRDLSTVAWIMQGAASMPPDLLRRWFELLSPERIIMAYGMTENLGLATLRGDEWLRHPGSVGRGFRETEISIRDEQGEAVPTGEIGEIYLRAPMNDTFRYLGGATPAVPTVDGFRSAGDLGSLDEDGYLYIADRRTDMIVTGGANVFPAEVENALIAHTDIVDVVVLGLRDPEWGRRVHAVVQMADGADGLTADDVIAYAKGRLARYKVPKTVEFVDEIPRSAATKVSRSAMLEARGG